MKPYIIGIAGESGVGKSTITKIIQLFYNAKNTTVISTDDLHKWERTNPIWNKVTHLNPEANNLLLGDVHLKCLAEGTPIYRSGYNHNTGGFNPPVEVVPKQVVINQGLHAFYTKETQKYTDLKLFIDTDDTLRTHWKIIRDTEKRGYKYNEVLKAIDRRRVDAELITQEQLKVADVIITIKPTAPIQKVGDKHEKIQVVVETKVVRNLNEELLCFIKEYSNAIQDFVQLSNSIGQKVENCQAAGGNISIKVGDKMVIKSSGFLMKDVSYEEGHTTVEYNYINEVCTEDGYNKLLRSDHFYTERRPSMEVGFHSILKKYVAHSHPVYLTAILSHKASEKIIKDLYSDFNYIYIPYSLPGYELFASIRKAGGTYDIYFLENHGVIINSETLVGLEEKFNYITNIAQEYIVADLEPFNLSFADKITTEELMFPDAVVLNSNLEVTAANKYINYIVAGNGRPLPKDSIVQLLMMESEKYRRSI